MFLLDEAEFEESEEESVVASDGNEENGIVGDSLGLGNAGVVSSAEIIGEAEQEVAEPEEEFEAEVEEEQSEASEIEYSSMTKTEKYLKNYARLIRKIRQRVRGKNTILTTKGLKEVRSNLDIVLVLSGTEGSGKSNLSVQIGRDLDPKHFSFERNMIAVPDWAKVQELSSKLPKGAPIILDEAITALYKRDFASTGNKELIKFFNVCRKRNQIFILCVPRFGSLDRDVRERVLLNVIIPSEQDSGLAVVHQRDDNPYLMGDKWHLDLSYEISSGGAKAIKSGKYQRFDMLANTEERVFLMRKTPCFVMPIRYLYDEDLDAAYNSFVDSQKEAFLRSEREAERNKLKAKSDEVNRKVLEKEEADVIKTKLKSQLRKSVGMLALNGFDKDKIAQALGVPVLTVSKLLRDEHIFPNDIKVAQARIALGSV